MSPFRAGTALFLLAVSATSASAETRWLITDPDQTKALRVSTEQAAQKARSEGSCYRPARPRECRFRDGAWTCMAENPTKPSDCGERGKWKTALRE